MKLPGASPRGIVRSASHTKSLSENQRFSETLLSGVPAPEERGICFANQLTSKDFREPSGMS